MSEFWIVTSIGHCATQWLATVLDAQDGIKAHHELKTAVSGMAWETALKYEQRNGAASAKYRDYWAQIDRELTENQIVVDVNSWMPTAVFDMIENGKHKPDRVVFIARHGVSQLHSLWHHSKAWNDAPLTSYHLSGYIEDLSGKETAEMTRWERLCHLWVYSILAYRDADAQFSGYYNDVSFTAVTFEKLTQTPYGLQAILPHMTHAQTLHWRRRDINRKVDHQRRPGNLWEMWTPEMREVFTAVCSDAMERMGYEVPK